MGKKIEFTGNYTDHSTNQGFQFEFHCQRCGTGYRSSFQASAVGTISTLLDTAGSLLGGVFGKAADLGNKARSVTWERAHDDAFVQAYEEIKSDFIQCPRCSGWVCSKGCWNGEKGLCKQCAPDMGVEMAAAQASRTVEEIWAHSKVAEEDLVMLKEKEWREGVRASCPACGKPMKDHSKFCPECGADVQANQHCTQCGAKLATGARFCGGCGAKV
jgi:hypothetical protein